MPENEDININPEEIINNSTVYSNELQIEVVPKSVALYALNLLKLSKGMDILNEKLKELNNIHL